MGCNDPRHREEFLAWLKERIEKAGESVVDPPWKFKAALASGNPKDLKAEVWREWYDHMNQGWKEAAKAAGGFWEEEAPKFDYGESPNHPVDWGEPGQVYKGPRGGRYRINSNGRKSYDVP